MLVLLDVPFLPVCSTTQGSLEDGKRGENLTSLLNVASDRFAVA